MQHGLSITIGIFLPTQNPKICYFSMQGDAFQDYKMSSKQACKVGTPRKQTHLHPPHGTCP
jgi:hypothetical protein